MTEKDVLSTLFESLSSNQSSDNHCFFLLSIDFKQTFDRPRPRNDAATISTPWEAGRMIYHSNWRKAGVRPLTSFVLSRFGLSDETDTSTESNGMQWNIATCLEGT